MQVHKMTKEEKDRYGFIKLGPAVLYELGVMSFKSCRRCRVKEAVYGEHCAKCYGPSVKWKGK